MGTPLGRRATDLALRVTKEMACSIGRSMAALVVTERHLWLNLSSIQGKERAFLLDAPLLPTGLFGEAVDAVVNRFRHAKTQGEAFERYLPCRSGPRRLRKGGRSFRPAPTAPARSRTSLHGIPLNQPGMQDGALSVIQSRRAWVKRSSSRGTHHHDWAHKLWFTGELSLAVLHFRAPLGIPAGHRPPALRGRSPWRISRKLGEALQTFPRGSCAQVIDVHVLINKSF
ncbi:uncharacterized protein LOC119888200 [Micropterus salmoides]|uniref:uncharacterized protein LOC119888200 n=1 Tax=Micropterus salmoides TaxID=27706 RepID=UPI0018EDBB0B|nr:uncharacterized protein LOC119888200 [Micropterus salmoides]